ncbi:Flagellar protein [Azotobacter vinelandii CA]|uniref:Flagellar protein n=2 Tax=Azotobacter vinelandii TaxID=354 RepID=C1DKV5_AZOVD|nr:flagellar protein FlaG [Azotobacter vinelandii]ACO78957.1 Flagellar protein [Azotobacter vinelandii DJ]AGK13470.1 Flagellar protein [Azotobacter vinelandii CA]AGK17880.1 Flagellar protein [Azotobacter vinelandii CA6]WKN19941.1 flagellar protein FlaG [Azotobacter vinelandii]SFY12379.1 flagellar protein FlaG [Azotobacter vinelandii]
MSSPLNDAGTLSNSPLTNLTPRQRLENALDELPPAPGSAAAQAEGAQPGLVAREELVEPLKRINEVLSSYGVEFHLSEPGQRVVTEIVDRESGEVIRQIPSEEVLRIAENLERLRGILLRETA